MVVVLARGLTKKRMVGVGIERVLVEIVRMHMDGYLFHETDEANYPSIGRHGLLSRDEAARRGVFPVFTGGSDLTKALDDDYGLSDFVFLRFTKSGLMPAHRNERRMRRPRVLWIDPEVLLLAGVRIALGCANRRRTRIYRVARACHEMDGEAMRWVFGLSEYDEADIHMRQRLLRVLKYEVLVPKCVPPQYIRGDE